MNPGIDTVLNLTQITATVEAVGLPNIKVNTFASGTANNTGTVNFTSNGGSASCPAAGAGTAKMSGSLKFNSTPGITVTP